MRTLFVAALLSAAVPLSAQVVERPVAFDSAGRIMAINPRLAERLGLTAPAWPIVDAFREARLFAVDSERSFVLSVERPTGAFERYPLTSDQRVALQHAVDVGMLQSGRPTGEIGSTVISEPAGFSFAGHQAVLGLLIYGPFAAGALEGSYAAAAYVGATGVAFFVANDISQNTTITHAQDHLAYYGGFGGAGAAELVNTISGAGDQRGNRLFTLSGAVAGAVYGGVAGKSLSDAEAHAATGGMTAGALLLAGAAYAGGTNDRATAVAALGGEVLGFKVGIGYPRHASYTVTAGDATVVGLSGILGAGVSGVIVEGIHEANSIGARRVTGLLTAGYAAGLLVGDVALARPYDFTQPQAHYLELSALAGGLVGATIPIAARTGSPTFATAMIEGGALLGTSITVSALHPARAGEPRVDVGDRDQSGDGRFHLTPAALLGILTKAPGRFEVLRYEF